MLKPITLIKLNNRTCRHNHKTQLVNKRTHSKQGTHWRDQDHRKLLSKHQPSQEHHLKFCQEKGKIFLLGIMNADFSLSYIYLLLKSDFHKRSSYLFPQLLHVFREKTKSAESSPHLTIDTLRELQHKGLSFSLFQKYICM